MIGKMMELTFNLTEDRREPLKPQSLKDFELTFGNGSGVNVQSNNWVQGRLQMDNLRQTFVNIQQGKDNEPFDITGYILQFCGRTPFDGKQQSYRVIDNSSVVVDGLHGRFRYTFPAQAFAVAGTYKQAYFRLIRLSDYKCIATLEFDLSVLEDFVFADMVPSDYISPFNDILNQLLDGEKKFKADTQTLYEEAAKRLNDAVTQLTQLGTDVKTTLTTEQAALQQLIEKIKENNPFTQAEADAFKQAIEDKLAALDSIYEHTYPTLADLQADKTITAGKPLKTGGYYALGDGGGAIYDIMDTKPDAYYETLQNGLYAKLRYTPKVINVAQWGVSPSQDDNYDKIQMIFDKYGQGANIYFPNGRYNVSKTLILSAAYCRLVGDAETEFQKTTTDLSGYTCIFNSRTIDLSKLDVALIIGPANNQSETVYHHQIKLESMRFSSPDVTSFARTNYGIIAIGTAYLSLSHCFAYGFYLNIKQYESFGLSLSQTQSNGALSASLFLDHSIHVSAVDCGFESLRPQDSAIVATNESIATITGSVVTVNGVAADTSSDLTLVGCSYETNYQTFRATAGATINVIGGNIERHQDPANSADTPLVYCTDNSKVYVDSANWRWQNYSGSPTWDHLLSYSTNQGCKVVITNCQFSNFPKLTHYDGGADYVIWDQDFNMYKTYTAQINPADGVTVQGQTLQRNHDGQCFLNVGFTVTKELGYMQSLLSFPPSFKPWDGCYIQFLQQSTKQTYQAFTKDGQIKVYDTVPAGTQAILTFSYQAHD